MRTLLKNLLALFVFALLFLGTVTVSQSAPLIPSRFVPGDETASLAANTQQSPSLSLGNGSFLAVWEDNRANLSGSFFEGETSYDIYGMLLDTAGNPLSTVPIPIAAGPASQQKPQAIWNGTNWLVVYESYNLGGTGFYYQKSMEAVRVSPSGQVIDSKPIKLYGLTPSGYGWGVASDGDNWVIVNQGTSTSGGVVAVRISADGLMLDPSAKILVPAAYYARSNFKLAYASSVFLLTFDDLLIGGTYIRFDSNLNLLDPAPSETFDLSLLDLASNGTEFYAIWTQQQPNFTYPLYGTRINAAGQKLDGGGVNISSSNVPQAYTVSQVTWDSLNWKVTWGFNNNVRVARVTPSGQVLDPGGVAVPGPQTGLSVGTGNGGVQLIWATLSSSNDVFSANINAANIAGNNQTLSLGAPMQLSADIATNGASYMMVYESITASNERVVAQPLDAAGNPLTTEPIELDSETTIGSPAVAWNGSVYMAAWSNSSGIVAQRLQPDGTKIDATPFLVMSPGFGPVDIEAMGNNFLVVGRKFGFTIELINTIAARVDGNGTVLDTSTIVLGYVFASSPRVTVLGERWFVAWIDNSTHDDPAAQILGKFVDASGTPSSIINMGYLSTAGGNAIFSVGLASSGTVALVVHPQELTSGVENDLRGVLVHPDGTVASVVNLTPWEGNQYRPRVAWEGTNFVLVFQDQKNRFTAYSLEQLDARSDIFGMRVSPAGTILDPQGFLFSNSPLAETSPNVIALNGTTLVAASLMRNESPYINYRIGYQLYGDGNQWPVAVANSNSTGGDVPFSVNFSASGSMDLDGSIASYLWDFGDGATSTQTNPSHQYTTAGNYVAVLTVTDNQGAQSSETVAIRASNPNQIPVAAASASPMSGPAPLAVIFYADGSYDPDGFIGNIKWTFHDGSVYWGSPAYHTYTNNGTFPVTLTVFDANGATGTDFLTIQVGGTLPTPTPTPTNTPAPGGGAMHVSSIDVSLVSGNGNRNHANALVTVMDANGQPVSGATVSGVFTGDSNSATSGVTDGNGQVTLASSVKKNGTNWTFCVNDITKTGWTYASAVNLETCDSTGGQPPPTATPAPTATPGGGATFHVGDLDGAATPSGTRWDATVVITVHDETEMLLAGVTVSGLWGNGTSGSGSCVTDANGQCSISKLGLRSIVPTVSFSVTDATKAGYTYLAGNNHDPDGESDGTSLEILKP